MSTWKHRWTKAVSEYAAAGYSEASFSCSWPLDTHYRKAVGLRLHSWVIDQALKLLSPVKGCMTPAERLAFRSIKQAPEGGEPCRPGGDPLGPCPFVVLSLLIWHQSWAGRYCFSAILRDFDTCSNYPSSHLWGAPVLHCCALFWQTVSASSLGTSRPC